MQEALERYVAVRAAPELEVLGRTGGIVEADRATVVPMLERLQVASRPPRMPASTETAALSQAQQHDVYGSMVALRGNVSAQEAMATQDRVILGLRKETRTTVKRGQGDYDDRIVVLWRDAEGQDMCGSSSKLPPSRPLNTMATPRRGRSALVLLT
ncbi:hypothetical protein [Stenotrophomonas sp. 169]|uniref:hypothetical protein n=1 Tax=Stenotrophomonas sp. 169 TaxID=2770322 RepID=UPI001CB778E6|nr:hypothetical protein [Stenotrophomonas sp. 169]